MAKTALTAIDANILVRVLTNDPPDMAGQASALIESRTCFVSAVVLLETFFVLKSVYGHEKPKLLESLKVISSLGLVFDQPLALQKVIAWYRSGMDFGDAMTLAYASPADEPVTFDAGFVKKAKKISASPPVVHGSNARP